MVHGDSVVPGDGVVHGDGVAHEGPAGWRKGRTTQGDQCRTAFRVSSSTEARKRELWRSGAGGTPPAGTSRRSPEKSGQLTPECWEGAAGSPRGMRGR